MILSLGLLLAAVPAANSTEAEHRAAVPVIAKGDRLTLVSQVGPITIERPVTALQGARPHDRRIFVRTDDGDVFAAPIRIDGDAPNE